MRKKKKRESEPKGAATERSRRFRERQRLGISIEEEMARTERATKAKQPITQVEVDRLPLSLSGALLRETVARKTLKLPDNLKERQERAVRQFRGY